MSRIAKTPVAIPAGVEVSIKGHKGTLKQTFNAGVIIEQ